MNKEEALGFLRHHQPMPEDEMLTQELMDKYDEIRKYFEANPDVQCIPLFFGSFGEDGFGIYEMVKLVLYKLPPEDVIKYLKKFLYSKNRNIRYWCVVFSMNYDSPELIEPLEHCLKDQDLGIKVLALDALEFIPEKRVTRILQDTYKNELDNDVKKDIEEALKYRKEKFGY